VRDEQLVRWNKVRLTLTTHSAGGLTDNDFDMARRIDGLG
jgi:4a-hydroxytetrahydrobiopterin dehydratase